MIPSLRMLVISSKVSSSSSEAGYAPTNRTPGMTQLLSGVGPQYCDGVH